MSIVSHILDNVLVHQYSPPIIIETTKWNLTDLFFAMIDFIGVSINNWISFLFTLESYLTKGIIFSRAVLKNVNLL